MKYLLTVLVLFFSFQFSFSQTAQNTNIDAVEYFDVNKRWYNEFTEHWFYFHDIPEEEIRNSIVFWEQIGRDLKSPENEWGGTYGNGGETHGDYLRWSEKSGFIWLAVNKCIGGPMHIMQGKVKVSSYSVKFIPEKVLGSGGDHGGDTSNHSKPKEFLLVKWRKKNFLVTPSKIRDFADFTAGLNQDYSGFYDNGWYFSEVMRGFSGSANELPIFPAGYEHYVKKPFKATISSIGKSFRRPKAKEYDEDKKLIETQYDDFVTEVILDVGKSSNIKPNIFLNFVPENDEYSTDGVLVKKVFENYSIAEYIKDIPKKTCKKSEYEDCTMTEGKLLKAGMKVSTTSEW